MNELKNQVETLIKKAAEASDPDDALKFSQAATNAADAMWVLRNVEAK